MFCTLEAPAVVSVYCVGVGTTFYIIVLLQWVKHGHVLHVTKSI